MALFQPNPRRAQEYAKPALRETALCGPPFARHNVYYEAFISAGGQKRNGGISMFNQSVVGGMDPDRKMLSSKRAVTSNMNWIRKHYKVPAKIGGKVRYKEQYIGYIRGSNGPFLYIDFGDVVAKRGYYHPTDQMEYLD